MKKFLISLLMLFLGINVYAASGSISITPSTIKASKQYTIKIIANGSGKIRGADLTYAVSGNLRVVSASAASGFKEQDRLGKHLIITGNKSSGSTVINLVVTGTEGTGTISVSGDLSIGDSFDTVEVSKTQTITIKPLYTEEELKAMADQKAKEEEEARLKKEEDKKLTEEAEKAVKKAEEELTSGTYEEAIKKVDALKNRGLEETINKFNERLNKVNFDIKVNEKVEEVLKNHKPVVCEEDHKLCILIAGIIGMILILENIFLFIKKK